MNYTVVFFDKPYITDRTDLSTRYSETNVRNEILNAQQYDLYPILGKNLYERFDTDIDNDDYGTSSYQTDHPKYYELMEEYILPFLLWASYKRVVLNVGIRPTNSGLGALAGDGFTASDAATKGNKLQEVDEKIGFLENKLKEYIDKFNADFDELEEATDLLSDEANYYKPSTEGKIGFFPKKRYKWNNYR